MPLDDLVQERRMLPCDEECAAKERNKKMAESLKGMIEGIGMDMCIVGAVCCVFLFFFFWGGGGGGGVKGGGGGGVCFGEKGGIAPKTAKAWRGK